VTAEYIKVIDVLIICFNLLFNPSFSGDKGGLLTWIADPSHKNNLVDFSKF